MNLTAVIGTPGAGKSTLTGRLIGRPAGGQAGMVLRMRDLAHRHRAGTEVGTPSADPLGWLPDRTANRLLRAALGRAFHGGAGLVLLENLPGSLAQSVALRQQARELSARLAVVELQAPDVVVADRVRPRRPHAVDHLNAPAKETTRARLDRNAASW